MVYWFAGVALAVEDAAHIGEGLPAVIVVFGRLISDQDGGYRDDRGDADRVEFHRLFTGVMSCSRRNLNGRRDRNATCRPSLNGVASPMRAWPTG